MAPFIIIGVIFAASEVAARTATALGRNKRLKGMGPVKVVKATLAISEGEMQFLRTSPVGDLVAGMLNRGAYLNGEGPCRD